MPIRKPEVEKLTFGARHVPVKCIVTYIVTIIWSYIILCNTILRRSIIEIKIEKKISDFHGVI